MTGTCPICSAEQRESLPCKACMAQIARNLRAVPGILAELDLAASRQARLTAPTPGGLASERSPIGWEATEAARDLTITLIRWANTATRRPSYYATTATRQLLAHLTHVRAHTDTPDFAGHFADNIDTARRIIDKPDQRPSVGACPTLLDDGECGAPLYLDPEAGTVHCPRCHRTFDRTELRHLGDMLLSSGSVDIFRAEWATGVPASTIRRWIAEERCTAHKVRGRLMVAVADVKAARDRTHRTTTSPS